jgi:plasmid stabilization system protein ParE
MALLSVFWTETAIAQRNHIFMYWNKRNGSKTYSKNLLSIINNNVDLIKRFPRLGRKTDFDGHRSLTLGNFSLFYRFDSERIIITAFWDNRQDPEKLLRILKNKTDFIS